MIESEGMKGDKEREREERRRKEDAREKDHTGR